MMTGINLLQITNLANIDFADIGHVRSLISGAGLPDALIISGVDSTSHQGYMKAACVLKGLCQNFSVPLNRILLSPSERDVAQLRSFNDSFYRPLFNVPFGFATCGFLNFDGLQIVGLNAFRGPRPIGISESQFLEISRQANDLNQGKPVPRILVTNRPLGKWEDWPKIGLTQWAAESSLLELTTEQARPQIDSIVSTAAEENQVLLYRFEDERLTCIRQLGKVGQWVPFVDGFVDLSQWLHHFRKMSLQNPIHTKAISLFLARALSCYQNAAHFNAIHESVLMLKNRISRASPHNTTTGHDGKSIKGDALVLHDGKYVPAYFGWRYVALLEAAAPTTVTT